MPVNMSVVNIVAPLLNNYSLRESIEIFKAKTPLIIQNGWCYWAPVSIILFVFIKSESTRFYIFNCFAYFWQIYLAYKVNEAVLWECLSKIMFYLFFECWIIYLYYMDKYMDWEPSLDRSWIFKRYKRPGQSKPCILE